MRMTQWTLLLAMLVLVGCKSSYETRGYDVTVQNQSNGPVTIWLTKDGPPYEAGWLAPEDLAVQSPKQDSKASGVRVPAGKTASTDLVHGQFEPQTHAVLRVYAGQRTFDELLASSSGDKTRIDYRLHPGKSSLVVSGTQPVVSVKEENQSP